jgi:hypothetical protein
LVGKATVAYIGKYGNTACHTQTSRLAHRAKNWQTLLLLYLMPVHQIIINQYQAVAVAGV